MAPSSASSIVGPFVVRSRKGNFGNQDLESALRMALAHRQEPDVEFVETSSGRRFTCVELIDALDRQDHRPAIDPPSAPTRPVAPGLASFRNFATSTVDVDLVPPDEEATQTVKVEAVPARRTSDRMAKRSDRSRVVGGGNALLLVALTVGALALGVVALLLLRAG